MPAPLMSKDEVLQRLTRAFRRYGYDAATLSRLSAETGLVKASLYHYFPGGKEEMARAVLSDSADWLQREVLDRLTARGDPRARLRAFAKTLDAFYDSGRESCLLGVMTIGDGRDLLSAAVRASLDAWIEALARVAIDAGVNAKTARARAEDALAAIQGALVLTRGAQSRTVFARTLASLPERLLGG